MRLGQGRENAKQYLRDNPALMEEISKKVLEKRGLLGVPTGTPTENGQQVEPVRPEVAKKEPAGRKQPAMAE